MQYLNYFYNASDVVKYVILLLVICEFLLFSLFFVKGFSLLRIYFRVQKMKKNIKNKNYDDRLLCELFKSIGESKKSNPKKLEKKLENELSLIQVQLNYGLGIFASLGALSPFIGLFGTVWGILKSFESIKNSSNTSLEFIAPHISESLFATALGLFVAIPSVLFYNLFSKFVDLIMSHFEYSLNSMLIEIEYENSQN